MRTAALPAEHQHHSDPGVYNPVVHKAFGVVGVELGRMTLAVSDLAAELKGDRMPQPGEEIDLLFADIENILVELTVAVDDMAMLLKPPDTPIEEPWYEHP